VDRSATFLQGRGYQTKVNGLLRERMLEEIGK